MELRYPIIIIIIFILLICYFFIFKKKKKKYTSGSKIANTSYIKNTAYYKKKIKEYKLFTIIIQAFIITAIISSTILIGRLSKIESNNTNEYNRDIFLCMDVSDSVNELNLDLVNSLKDVVNNLKGERFGISIFNTSSVTLVPLTDDYDYVISVLEQIKASLELTNSPDLNSDNFDFYLINYITSGTLEDNETKGSSLIGDGLATCVYSFSDLDDTERTRIIILSTDNEPYGTQLVTLDEAAQISKSKGIKVFGIATKLIRPEADFKEATQITGGKYYKYSDSTTTEIVNDIEATSKSLLKKKVETKVTDIPQIPFIILIFSIITLIIIRRKVIS